MTIREHERRARRRNHAQLKTETEEKREQRKRERELQRGALERGRVIVYSLREWAEMRNISLATARRLVAAGRVKLTYLSTRRVGVRSDHDLEYLDSCIRDGA
jgi:hypothetical protein